MKILITGGSGFIGNYLGDYLHEEYDLKITGTQESKSAIHTTNKREIPYVQTDYSIESLSKIISGFGPDAVVHLAALRPDGSQVSLSDYLVNVNITANLFEACYSQNIVNIVNISSRLAYSHQSKIPWIENSSENPDNYYGTSKLWCEQAGALFNQKGLSIKSLRLGQVIGLGERAGYALQVYMDNAIQGQPLQVFGKNLGKRHYIYAKDVAAAIKAAIAKTESKGVFNIGMAQTYSFEELAKTIVKVFGNKSEIIYHKEAKADERIYHMSIEKAREELGWEPEYDLEQTYKDIKKDLEKQA